MENTIYLSPVMGRKAPRQVLSISRAVLIWCYTVMWNYLLQLSILVREAGSPKMWAILPLKPSLARSLIKIVKLY